MLTRKHSIEGKNPFGQAAELFDSMDADAAMKLAMVAGDITLILDDTGTVLDAAFDHDHFSGLGNLTGQNWIETVTVESRPKIMEMLAAARRGEVQHWRQVNHIIENGDIPIRYVVVPVNGGEHRIAFGRDLREAAKLQQRLLQVQQSLERDYMQLRQLETRYRMVFESSQEPVVIIDAAGHRVREVNPAAEALFGARQGGLIGKKLLSLFDRKSRDDVLTLIGAAQAAGSVAPSSVTLAKGSTPATLAASSFTQDRERYLLLRCSTDQGAPVKRDAKALPDLVERMPDAFLVADHDMKLVSANAAFVEMVRAGSLDHVRGRHLSEWVGRPSIDLELIEKQIDQHGAARNVSTILRARDEDAGEQVELSAVKTGSDTPLYGFVIRPIARRLRDLPPGSADMPRSVEQLTDLVGRMSLKDIVRESTDLIERLCIEAALSYTSDNRASAAEILGLSRQSLYSKLHRHGLGNLTGEND